MSQPDIRHFRINVYSDMPKNYWKDFHKCREVYFPLLKQLSTILQNYNILQVWHFFEPYLEFNFIAEFNEGQRATWTIVRHLDENVYAHLQCWHSSNVTLDKAEWYAKNTEEQVVGIKRYAFTSSIAMWMMSYEKSIREGHGLDYQVMRSIHSLSNQLGLNYRAEGWLCLRRSIFCLLAWFASFVPFARRKPVHVAAWICRKILRQKSMA